MGLRVLEHEFQEASGCFERPVKDLAGVVQWLTLSSHTLKGSFLAGPFCEEVTCSPCQSGFSPTAPNGLQSVW